MTYKFCVCAHVFVCQLATQNWEGQEETNPLRHYQGHKMNTQ